MIELKDLDPSNPFLTQLQGPDDGEPVTIVNTFVAPEGSVEAALEVWRKDSYVMKPKPGFISAQLYRGVGDSRSFTNVAEWDSLTDLRNAFNSPEFQDLLPLYPDGSVAYPVLFRKTRVRGVCVA